MVRIMMVQALRRVAQAEPMRNQASLLLRGGLSKSTGFA
jgi:hypothetical protein